LAVDDYAALKALKRHAGRSLTDEQALYFLSLIDHDGDGWITLDEFGAFFRDSRRLHGKARGERENWLGEEEEEEHNATSSSHVINATSSSHVINATSSVGEEERPRRRTPERPRGGKARDDGHGNHGRGAVPHRLTETSAGGVPRLQASHPTTAGTPGEGRLTRVSETKRRQRSGHSLPRRRSKSPIRAAGEGLQRHREYWRKGLEEPEVPDAGELLPDWAWEAMPPPDYPISPLITPNWPPIRSLSLGGRPLNKGLTSSRASTSTTQR